MPSKDMSEILSRCRTGAAGAAAYKGIIAVAAIAVVSGIAAGVMVMNKPTPDPVEDNFAVADHEVLGIDDCEQVSNIFAYNPTTGDRIPNDEVEWTVSDPTVVTYDPVNGAVSSASRKNKGASIAVRGSSFGVK